MASRASWGWPGCHQGQSQGPSPSQGISVPESPSEPAGHVTLSSLVPAPAESGPACLALQNDPRGKAGPSPTETVGKGTERANPPLGKTSTAFNQGQAECRGYLLLTLCQALQYLRQGALWAWCFHCCAHTPACTHCKLPALHFAAAT